MSGTHISDDGAPETYSRRRTPEPAHTPEPASGFETRRRIQRSPSAWEVLADTSSRMDAELRGEAEVEREELRHGESAGISLALRLHACRDRRVRCQLLNGDDVDILVRDVSKHWVRGETARGESLIQMAAIVTLQGLPVRAGVWAGRLVSESTFQMALRAVMGEGAAAVLTHSTGSVRGRVVSVGADWVDVLGAASGGAVGGTAGVASQLVTIATANILRADVSRHIG
ncbi:MAG: hypothetical protein QM705_07125 [Ancrocorticia sp.]